MTRRHAASSGGKAVIVFDRTALASLAAHRWYWYRGQHGNGSEACESIVGRAH